MSEDNFRGNAKDRASLSPVTISLFSKNSGQKNDSITPDIKKLRRKPKLKRSTNAVNDVDSSLSCQIKHEVMSDAKDSDTDEMISLASLKKKRRKNQPKSSESERQTKFEREDDFEFLSPVVEVKVDLDQHSENDEAYLADPTVVMLKSLVDEISDASIIWNVVKAKILSKYSLWNVLLDKASLPVEDILEVEESSATADINVNLKNRQQFIKVMEQVELILDEFKSLMDSCLQMTDINELPDDTLDICLSPEICGAFGGSMRITWRMVDCSKILSKHRYFFHRQDLPEEVAKASCKKVKARKKRAPKLCKEEDKVAGDDVTISPSDLTTLIAKEPKKEDDGIVERSQGCGSDFGQENWGHEDNDNLDMMEENFNSDEDSQPLEKIRKLKNGLKRRRKAVRRKRAVPKEGPERPAERPFRKNPEDKRYYCTFPGCSSGEAKNWTCSTGAWKHFLSEHSIVAENAYCVFTCDTCGKRFPIKALLNQHQKEKHISHFEFVCTVCAKRLPTNPALLMHMRMHTGEKPFSCDLCTYRSIRLAAITQHKMRMHDSETEPRLRKHVCEKCGKTFKERCKLKEHIKTHSDIRTFLCGFCGKGLKNRQSLNRHMFTHGLKNECTNCGKYFSTPHTLNIHQRDKHGMSI